MNTNLNWAYAYGIPECRGQLRGGPEFVNADFQVTEDLGFEPTGEGEHCYIYLEKDGDNTQWAAKQLARAADMAAKDVGYCGLKDRHAITRQWFSLYDPQQKLNQFSPQLEGGLKVLAVSRHRHKLKRGMHRSNAFQLTLRAVEGDIEARLANIRAGGVPNYFGEQRFGIDNNNLNTAQQLFADRRSVKSQQQRSMAISAARSYVFNRALSARVAAGNWRQLLAGEDGQPSGPLWGRGKPNLEGEALTFEMNALAEDKDWCNGLEFVGLSQERRPLVCTPDNFTAEADGSIWRLSFSLAPGQYATSVLRECIQGSL